MTRQTKSAKTSGTTGRTHPYKIKKETIIVLSGVYRPVVIPSCPNCGMDFKVSKVQIQSNQMRFKCPECGISIENTTTNRCSVCQTRCSDSETYNAHRWGGCAYAGVKYPGRERMRGCEKVEKVV